MLKAKNYDASPLKNLKQIYYKINKLYVKWSGKQFIP